MRRDALTAIGMTDTNYGWTVEMQVKAIRAGLRVSEVPVRYRKRIGVSKISGTVSGTFKAGYKIIFTIFRYAFEQPLRALHTPRGILEAQDATTNQSAQSQT